MTEPNKIGSLVATESGDVMGALGDEASSHADGMPRISLLARDMILDAICGAVKAGTVPRPSVAGDAPVLALAKDLAEEFSFVLAASQKSVS